jgi:hypothetical protein
MKRSLVALLSFSMALCYLHGHAQEKLTLYYDENGKGLDTKKKAAFYRIVTFDQSNKPIGIVEDFYLNGKTQAKGEASIIDKFDNRKSRWKGQVQNYDEKGKLSGQSNYDEEGRLDGAQVTYNTDGIKSEEFEYSHGNPTKDYYLTYDKKGNAIRYSYLTHLPMKLATSDKVIVPFTEKKLIYQDGIPVQFYFIDGLSVAVKISTKQLYGNYYEAYITIENGSGNQFDFDPSDITASFIKDGKVTEAEVLGYTEYMKKVKRRQSWTAAFTAFVEVAAASSAGYSSSNLNATAQSSTGKSVTINATSSTYNGAAAYAASQNAANNMSQMANQQYNIKQNINEGYLKINTVFPNSRIIGFINIKHEDADHILLNVPVNGKVYHFEL